MSSTANESVLDVMSEVSGPRRMNLSSTPANPTYFNSRRRGRLHAYSRPNFYQPLSVSPWQNSFMSGNKPSDSGLCKLHERYGFKAHYCTPSCY